MTSRTTLLDLARRVGEATGRDRELDAWIWNHLGHTEGDDAEIAWRKHLPMGPKEIVQGQTMAAAIEQFPNDLSGIARSWNVPPLTASIDAALALVEQRFPGTYVNLAPRFYIDGTIVLWTATIIRPLWEKWTPHEDWFDNFESPKPHEDRCHAILAALLAAEIERVSDDA